MNAFSDQLLREAPYQRHSTTSREAARSIGKQTNGLQRRVLDYFKDHPEGATDEQLIDGIGLGASTVRPRRIELVQLNLIKDSGRYALTKSGRRATVWILKPQSDPGWSATLMPPI